MCFFCVKRPINSIINLKNWFKLTKLRWPHQIYSLEQNWSECDLVFGIVKSPGRAKNWFVPNKRIFRTHKTKSLWRRIDKNTNFGKPNTSWTVFTQRTEILVKELQLHIGVLFAIKCWIKRNKTKNDSTPTRIIQRNAVASSAKLRRLSVRLLIGTGMRVESWRLHHRIRNEKLLLWWKPTQKIIPNHRS